MLSLQYVWKSALYCSVALASVLLAQPAAAQHAAAEELYRDGVERFESGDYEAACRAFAESFRIDPLPGALFTLATCEMRAGRIATAAVHYEQFISLVQKLPAAQQTAQEERRRVAEREARRLRGEVPFLRIDVGSGIPESSTVKLDGVILDAAALGTERAVDPGEHVIELVAADGAHSEQRVTVTHRERKTVFLAPVSTERVAAGPGVGAARPAPAVEASPDRSAVYVLGGIGVAGIIVGGVSGVVALRDKGIVDEECDGPACSLRGKDAAERGKKEALASTIGFGVGGAALLTAVIVYLSSGPDTASTGSSTRTTLVVGSNSVGLEGSF